MSIDAGTHHLDHQCRMRLVLAALLPLVFILTLEVSPAAAASPKACRVTNTDTGRTYPRLQQAVDAAKPGAHLVVKGTCHGGTLIDKDLVIRGVRSERRGKPVLDGDKKTRVLTINGKVEVNLRSLVITHGMATRIPNGGGISNKGRLTLNDVVVRGNMAGHSGGRGGGVYNEGVLRLLGVSGIQQLNRAKEGAGVYNAGTMTMRDTSRVAGNYRTMQGVGHGVYNTGTLTMKDASSIRKNTRGWPGNNGYGVYNTGVLVLTDSSTVQGNRGGVINLGGSVTMTGSSSIRYNVFGCPIFAGGSACIQVFSTWPPSHPAGLHSVGGTVTGAACAPHTFANVFRNYPYDCYIE